MKYAFIEENRSSFGVGKMCEALEVSRSGYYAWRRQPPTRRSQEDTELVDALRQIHQAGRQNYGSPKLTSELKKQGFTVSRKRVLRLMKAHGIRPKKRRARKPQTTQSGHGYRVATNLLARQFKVSAPNRVWVSDISYWPTEEGWLYVCVIIDLYSRKVVGWAMRSDLKADLALDAFQMAWGRRQPQEGLLFHSDRGVQYACEAFVGLLAAHGVTPSMSRKGNCWDNAVAESLFAILKREALDEIPQSHSQARRHLFEYLEVFYNRLRSHSTLGYLSPEEFERKEALVLN